MIDPKSERLIRLVDVPDLPWIPARRKGARLNPSTVFRWATVGLRGVKLETYPLGGTLYTSEAAMMRFAERRNMPKETGTTRTSSQRQKAVDRANAILESAGA